MLSHMAEEFVQDCNGHSLTLIINQQELRTLLLTQQSLEDQTVCLTSAQVDFPVTEDAQEVQDDRDRFLGKAVARFLHPAISTFI
jgi:hypothetical protein